MSKYHTLLLVKKAAKNNAMPSTIHRHINFALAGDEFEYRPKLSYAPERHMAKIGNV